MKPSVIFSLFILSSLLVIAIFADFISPYRYDEQHREFPFQKPGFSATQKTQVHFFVRGYEYKFIFLKTNIHLFGTQTEDNSNFFLLGTDMHGRDIFSRLIIASRVSVSISLLGVFITFCIGLLVGGLSGYIGGKVDALLMRTCEALMCFPFFYLMLALRAMLPLNLTSTQVYACIVAIMSFLAWPSVARVIRGMVLSIRQRDFIVCAELLGIGNLRVVYKHILPNTVSYALTAAFLSIPAYMLGESGLSFIGLGIQEPEPSWGNMLSAVMDIQVLTSYPWMLLPGFLILITVIACNTFGEHIKEKLC